MLRILSEGFLFGLATGSTCAAVCMPLLAPVLLVRRSATWGSTAGAVGEFLLGRLAAYAAVGAVCGALGSVAVYEGGARLLAAANIPLGLAMILLAFSDRPQGDFFCRLAHGVGGHARLPLALGLLTGFSPCPPFVKAAHLVLTEGGALRGVLFFLAFFVATSLFLTPLVVLGMAAVVRVLRSVGYVAAGVAGMVFLAAGVRSLTPVRLDLVEVEPRLATLSALLPEATDFSKKMGSPPFYHEAWRRREGKSDLVGYVAVTTDAAPGLRGYGGPVPVLVAVDARGAIRAVKVLENQETPEFVGGIVAEDFGRRFVGKSVRDPLALGVDVDGVTGATITSMAVIGGVRAAAHKLAAGVLRETVTAPAGPGWRPWLYRTPWIVLAFIAAAVVGERLRLARLRYAVMALSIAVVGLWLKAFFSVRLAVDIATLQLPRLSTGAVWYAIVLSALGVALLVGRVYCGWVCPFGALSEFLGRLTRSPLRPSAGLDRGLRAVKYLILVAVVLLFVVTADNGVLAFEPFADVFTLALGGPSTVRVAWLLFLLLGSLCLGRFFCRYLCPAGAAMAFVSRFRLLGRRRPEGCFDCAECLTLCPVSSQAPLSVPDAECMNCLECATCLRLEKRRPAGKEAAS